MQAGDHFQDRPQEYVFFCPSKLSLPLTIIGTDYKVERGAKRITDGWRDSNDPRYKDETEQEILDRLEAQAGEDTVQEDKMAALEDKMQDSKREMQVADALDEIRSRNARIERNEGTEQKVITKDKEERPFIELPHGHGKLYFNSEEEKQRTIAEDKLTAWKAFHDATGNRVKRGADGEIVQRWTPAEEAQGLHLLSSNPKAKPVPGLEDEIIEGSYAPDTRTDEEIWAELEAEAANDPDLQRWSKKKKKAPKPEPPKWAKGLKSEPAAKRQKM